MKALKLILLFFSIFAAQAFVSCKKDKSIDLNSYSSLYVMPDLKWAVVSVPYAPLRSSSDYGADVLNHSRKGDIFVISGKKTEKVVVETAGTDSKKKKPDEINYVVWYKCEKGWIEESLVTIYDTKFKAEKASEKLNNGSI